MSPRGRRPLIALPLAALALITGPVATAAICRATVVPRPPVAGVPRFRFLSGEGVAPVVQLRVTEVGDNREVCRVSSGASDREPGFTGDWTYGVVPPGFDERRCEPLSPRRAYEIGVISDCIGDLTFTVDRDGRVQPLARRSAHLADVAVREIDRFCDALALATKQRRGRLFARLQPDQRPAVWTEFQDANQLNVASKRGQVYDVAEVWTRSDAARTLSLTLGSGSGDWVHHVEYCFRPDTTLARSKSTLNTFNAADPDIDKEVSGATRERRRWFHAGDEVRVVRRVLDLATKRPAPERSLLDDEEPIYRSIGMLPFARLLK